jgi:hypothetical protein
VLAPVVQLIRLLYFKIDHARHGLRCGHCVPIESNLILFCNFESFATALEHKMAAFLISTCNAFRHMWTR